jgi:hypothetical protein
MKKIFFKSIILGMLGACVLFSCKKDSKENKEAVLPAQESMLMDFSNFQAPSVKSLQVDDITKYNNWTSSAITVGIWSGIVYLNSAVPVAAFKEAFNHPVVFIGNATWRSTYSITYSGVTYTAKLEGTINSNTTDWKMYVSKAGGSGADFSDFLWFTGTSSNDGTTAAWHLNKGPESNGTPYLDIDWVKDTSLRYTLADVLDPGVGNFLEYDKINEAGLDAQFLINTVNHTNDVTIQWNIAGKNGRVKCQSWYGDLEWHCWGVLYRNVICS